MHCINCKHYEKKHEEHPCCDCKNTAVPCSKEFYSRPLLWAPKNGIEHKAENDVVNHPAHYTQGGIECIDAMVETQGKEAVMSFCICNAFKYLWRHQNKENEISIDKAFWYLKKYIELRDMTNENH